MELPDVDRSFGYFPTFVDVVEDYAIFALDPEGRVVTWNSGAERIKGYARDEILGKHFSCFYTPEDQLARKPQRVLQHAIEHGSFSEEAERVRKDGSRFWASVVVTAIKDPEGNLRGFTKITRDMTERRRSEQMERERNAAREREKLRQRFLQLAAHELRNPMQGMKGMVELIRARLGAGKSLETQDALLNMLDREVDRLSVLLDEVLEAYRTDDPGFRIEMEPVELQEIIRNALAPLREAHENREYDLDLGRGPVSLYGEPMRLEVLFRNIFDNAIKYSFKGSRIGVAVTLEAETVAVAVSDDGVGIRARDLPHVFDGFYRGSNLRGHDPGGIGLGLHLSRQIVERHGGSIHIESREGAGTTVTVVLPRLEAARG